MLSKEKLRKKFIKLRKQKYFNIEDSVFKPLLKLITNTKRKKYHFIIPLTMNLAL